MAAGPLTEGLLVFGTIFAFEIVDRTNFGVISLATKHHHLDVWTGAVLAFLVSTAIAVAIGWIVVSFLPPYLWIVRLIGGAVLIAFGAKSLWDARAHPASEKLPQEPPRMSRAQVITEAFSLILLLEMGDNTQVFTIVFATEYPLALVFVAAAAALGCVSGIGSFAGRYLRGRVAAETLEYVLGVLLIVVGAFTVAWALGLLQVSL